MPTREIEGYRYLALGIKWEFWAQLGAPQGSGQPRQNVSLNLLKPTSRLTMSSWNCSEMFCWRGKWGVVKEKNIRPRRWPLHKGVNNQQCDVEIKKKETRNSVEMVVKTARVIESRMDKQQNLFIQSILGQLAGGSGRWVIGWPGYPMTLIRRPVVTSNR